MPDDLEDTRMRAFESVFANYDPQRSGTINSKDFLNLIDDLDRLQKKDAEPIINQQQRKDAEEVVNCGIRMSKDEVLDFLKSLNIELLRPQSQEDQSESASEAVSPQAYSDTTSPLIHARPRSALFSERPRATHNIARSISLQTVPRRNRGDIAERTFDCDGLKGLATADGSSAPLAQSTPHKHIAENPSHAGIGRRNPHMSIYSAVGEGSFSPSSPIRADVNESSSDIEEVIHLRDQVRMLQERERLSERTITTNEQQIQQLEALLAENRAEIACHDRASAGLRADHKTAEHDIEMLQQMIERLTLQLKQTQDKHDRVKSDLDTRILEDVNARDILADRDEELHNLQAELRSSQEDRKQIQMDRTQLKSRIAELEARCADARETVSKFNDTLARCIDLEQEKERLKSDLDQMKQASIPKEREELQVMQARLRRESNQEQREERFADMRLAIGLRQVSKATQTSEDLNKAKESASAVQEETLKQRYANLSDELLLQKSLIEQMSKLKPSLRKAKMKAFRGSTPYIGTANEKTSQSARTSWTTMAFLIILYSLVCLFLGYLIASQREIMNAPGVSYAEWRAWERANSLESLLNYDGVLGKSPYHWFEGQWNWLEKVGYWLQDRLEDRPWPS